MSSFASRAFVTGTVTVNHASRDALMPDHRVKCHCRWLRALRSSNHPSELVAAPASTWSIPLGCSSSMSSSLVADEVLACELADADVYALLPSTEQLALCPAELVEHCFSEKPDLA